MDIRCHFCSELHVVDDDEVETRVFHFRCTRCETLHFIRQGHVRRVTLPETATSSPPPDWPIEDRAERAAAWGPGAPATEVDDRDTLPSIAEDGEDTFAPLSGPPRGDPGADVDDRTPTVRIPPVPANRWLGRETLTSVAVLALGLGMVGYAAAGPSAQPQRALASGASVAPAALPNDFFATPAAASTATPAPEASGTAEPAARPKPRWSGRPRRAGAAR